MQNTARGVNPTRIPDTTNTADTAEGAVQLPGKNCGLCGLKTCEAFAEIVSKNPEAIKRCVYTEKSNSRPVSVNDRPSALVQEFREESITWKDNLGREYDFILDKFPGEAGPRETIILFNPSNVEKLGLKKGDVLYGRPGWISCGCPVSHVGIVVEEPDYFNGTVVWCVVGPMMARERGINIGYYNTTAYEGMVHYTKTELQIGKRYYFQPRYCMLQWRHCGLVNTLGKTKDGLRVRIEGLWIG
ncbi:MAG: (Fe-S)-binding protein [bacterium]